MCGSLSLPPESGLSHSHPTRETRDSSISPSPSSDARRQLAWVFSTREKRCTIAGFSPSCSSSCSFSTADAVSIMTQMFSLCLFSAVSFYRYFNLIRNGEGRDICVAFFSSSLSKSDSFFPGRQERQWTDPDDKLPSSSFYVHQTA